MDWLRCLVFLQAVMILTGCDTEKSRPVGLPDWQRADSRERRELARKLIGNNKPLDWDEAGVIRVFGRPSRDESGATAAYWYLIGPQEGIAIDEDWLVFEFKGGRVSSVRIIPD